MIISLIAAMDKKRVIGKDNSLPWHISDDLKRFKKITSGKPIIMGRKTYESIGRLLPDRQNIILTRSSTFKCEGADIVNSIDDAIEAVGDATEVMVIGGAQIYKEFLPIASKIYLTEVDLDVDGDVVFPDFNRCSWVEEFRELNKPEGEVPAFTFIDLVRK